MGYLRLILLAFALLPIACAGCSRPWPKDRVITINDVDEELQAGVQAAIATARMKLPEFWRVFNDPAVLL